MTIKRRKYDSYLSDRNNLEQLKTAIANVGYDAEDIAAEETAYKSYPNAAKIRQELYRLSHRNSPGN